MQPNPSLPLGPVTIEDRLAQPAPAPVALGTLRPGTLPLPPTTVDERLAQAPLPSIQPSPWHDARLHRVDEPHAQEDRMPDDDVSNCRA